jgi:hypothetical protein
MIIICSALQNKNSHLGLTGISFVYVFLFAFAFVWTPCQALYPSEVSKLYMQPIGYASNSFKRFSRTTPAQKVSPCPAFG